VGEQSVATYACRMVHRKPVLQMSHVSFGKGRAR
jgi:hypothetical protein